MCIDLSNLLTQVLLTVTLEITLLGVIVTITILENKKQLSITKEKHSFLTSPQANVQAPIQRTECSREALTHEASKRKFELSKRISYVLLLFGAVSLMLSIIYVSSILAFIGLGLTLWGALLLFTRPQKLVKASLLEPTAISSLTTIHHMIDELKYKGKAIYLPPKCLKELKGGTIFIPSKKEIVTPPVEELAEEKVFLENPKGICLTPPGLGLVNLYEKKLGKDFATVSLDYLQHNLRKLFIEDLEIAKDLEIEAEGDIVRAKITGSIYKDLCEEAKKLFNLCSSLGCPLCSSIAIVLTKATGKAIIIKKTGFSVDNKTIEVYYQLIGE